MSHLPHGQQLRDPSRDRLRGIDSFRSVEFGGRIEVQQIEAIGDLFEWNRVAETGPASSPAAVARGEEIARALNEASPPVLSREDTRQDFGPTIVAIGGKKHHGKDTAAWRLIECCFRKLRFGKAVYEAALVLNPVVPVPQEFVERDARLQPIETLDRFVQFFGWDDAKTHPAVRKVLTTLGTEIGRDVIGEDSWIDLLARRWVTEYARHLPIVITDVRFPNELAWVQSLPNVETWWVERPSFEDTVGDTAKHISENSLGPGNFDHVITNDGTVEDLWKKVEERVPYLTDSDAMEAMHEYVGWEDPTPTDC